MAPGRSTSVTGSTPVSATFTGSRLARPSPARRAESAYSPFFSPRNSKRPSAPVSRRTWLPGPIIEICIPPRPARRLRVAESVTSTPASGRPSSFFAIPRRTRPRRITTVKPLRVAPGASAMPATERSSKSSWRTSTRWPSPGRSRAALKHAVAARPHLRLALEAPHERGEQVLSRGRDGDGRALDRSALLAHHAADERRRAHERHVLRLRRPRGDGHVPRERDVAVVLGDEPVGLRRQAAQRVAAVRARARQEGRAVGAAGDEAHARDRARRVLVHHAPGEEGGGGESDRHRLRSAARRDGRRPAAAVAGVSDERPGLARRAVEHERAVRARLDPPRARAALEAQERTSGARAPVRERHAPAAHLPDRHRHGPGEGTRAHALALDGRHRGGLHAESGCRPRPPPRSGRCRRASSWPSAPRRTGPASRGCPGRGRATTSPSRRPRARHARPSRARRAPAPSAAGRRRRPRPPRRGVGRARRARRRRRRRRGGRRAGRRARRQCDGEGAVCARRSRGERLRQRLAARLAPGRGEAVLERQHGHGHSRRRTVRAEERATADLAGSPCARRRRWRRGRASATVVDRRDMAISCGRHSDALRLLA